VKASELALHRRALAACRPPAAHKFESCVFRCMRRLLLMILLSGCSSPHAIEPRAATELAAPAGEPRSCVSISAGEGLIILSEGTVGFRSGRTLWVNRLPAACHGLHPLNTLVVQMYGSPLCRGDQIRVIEHPMSVPGPTCTLGDFVPYRSR
jgi:hypothetical protein